MNQKSFFLFMMFFTLILAGCQEKSSKKSSSTTNALTCSGASFYTTPGCGGYCSITANAQTAVCLGGGTTTGGTTGTSSQCLGNNYYNVPGCAGYCMYYPNAAGCAGTTTSGSTGSNCTSPIAKTCANYCTTYPGALGCLPNGTNCWSSPSAAGCPGSSTALNPVWGTHYPGGEPVGSCSATYTSGSGTAVETRKATIIAASTYGYNPLTAGSYLNTSTMLMSVSSAKTFFMTDASLKLRVKVKPQQELTGSASPTFCYGRVRNGARIPGYTKLQYTVNVYGVSASNSMSYLGSAGSFETGVNSCSNAIDLSYWKEVSPTGVVIAIENVKANQNCQYSAYNGFTDCGSFKAIRSFDCWGLDLEVAADGTKTFN